MFLLSLGFEEKRKAEIIIALDRDCGGRMMPLTPNAKRLIDGPNLASVATVMPDGSPQVSPVWVDREGDIVRINATEKRQRYLNLKRDPRVALCIYDPKDPHQRVMIRGRVIEMTKNGAEDHIDKLSLKYTGNASYAHYDNDHDPRVMILIEPEHITGT